MRPISLVGASLWEAAMRPKQAFRPHGGLLQQKKKRKPIG